jgi:hypothetical protein
MKGFCILCEDAQSACFLRRFLKRRGHEIGREEIAPAGGGCGEQWVRERFPSELAVVRKYGGRLIVCTDADRKTVSERIQTLQDECKGKNVEAKKAGDSIAFTIPKRNIETWITHFLGQKVDEEHDYSPHIHRADKKKCETAAKGIEDYYLSLRGQPSMPKIPHLPSLNEACEEWKSLQI